MTGAWGPGHWALGLQWVCLYIFNHMSFVFVWILLQIACTPLW